MLSEQDIYILYRKAQGSFFDKPYRLPKDWNVYYGKMDKKNKKNKQCLELITKFFNTKWSNIDPQLYFAIGFEIFRSGFTYSKFFNIILLKQYISKDKAEKIGQTSIFEDFERSIAHVDNTIEGGKTSKLIRYANKRTGLQYTAVCDYLKNQIGKFFLIYLLEKRLITLGSDEKIQIPYVTLDYEDSVTRLQRIENDKDFKKILRKIS